MVNITKPSASNQTNKLDLNKVQLSKKNSFTDRANSLIRQFDLFNRIDSSNQHSTEPTKIVSSLLLPSQYIDLSLFFYSPNQSDKERDHVLLQTSTDSSVLTSSTLSNSSTSSVSNTSVVTGDPIAAVMNLTTSSEDEHRELVAEMEIIERLPTQERLKQAKRRRALQLKKWSEFDSRASFAKRAKNQRNLKFQQHVVLLDAIMRKDNDEVEHLLKTGITPNSANEDGLTAIHQVGTFFY